jgi:hypothetical protein
MESYTGIAYSARAENLLLAIALQESNLSARIQGPNDAGPARSFWQFEKIGVVDVFQRQKQPLQAMCSALVLPCEPGKLHLMMAYNDAIACVIARLTLRLDHRPLAVASTPSDAWDYYVKNWRPGKPHRDRWDGHSWPVACATTGILPRENRL